MPLCQHINSKSWTEGRSLALSLLQCVRKSVLNEKGTEDLETAPASCTSTESLHLQLIRAQRPAQSPTAQMNLDHPFCSPAVAVALVAKSSPLAAPKQSFPNPLSLTCPSESHLTFVITSVPYVQDHSSTTEDIARKAKQPPAARTSQAGGHYPGVQSCTTHTRPSLPPAPRELGGWTERAENTKHHDRQVRPEPRPGRVQPCVLRGGGWGVGSC